MRLGLHLQCHTSATSTGALLHPTRLQLPPVPQQLEPQVGLLGAAHEHREVALGGGGLDLAQRGGLGTSPACVSGTVGGSNGSGRQAYVMNGARGPSRATSYNSNWVDAYGIKCTTIADGVHPSLKPMHVPYGSRHWP